MAKPCGLRFIHHGTRLAVVEGDHKRVSVWQWQSEEGRARSLGHVAVDRDALADVEECSAGWLVAGGKDVVLVPRQGSKADSHAGARVAQYSLPLAPGPRGKAVEGAHGAGSALRYPSDMVALAVVPKWSLALALDRRNGVLQAVNLWSL
jgi:hypothetical protein